MKRFFTSFLVGLACSLIGALISYLFISNVDLSCRDCQGAAGILLLIFFGLTASFFLIGFVITFYRMRKR